MAQSLPFIAPGAVAGNPSLWGSSARFPTSSEAAGPAQADSHLDSVAAADVVKEIRADVAASALEGTEQRQCHNGHIDSGRASPSFSSSRLRCRF